MRTILRKIREVENNLGQIQFARHYQKMLPEMPSLEEYRRFIEALISCREVAQEEYEFVVDQLNRLKEEIPDKVQELQDRFAEITIYDSLAEDDEDEPTQEESASALKNTIKAFSKALKEAVKKIEEENEQSREELSKFKIVLFGKTKAGKSTIREALTKGDGKSIGRGGQSTTQEGHTYSWNNLEVYDTPGTLSVRDKNQNKEGIGDEERNALSHLQDSDIAIFMFTSDNIEEPELDYLRKICEEGREVLILLNVKSDLVNYPLFKARRKEREISPEAQKGNFARIRDFLKNKNVKKIPVILPIHAQAAFYSRGNSPELDEFYRKNKVRRSELFQLSRFQEVRNYLFQNILKRGKAMRANTIRTKFIATVKECAEENQKRFEPRLEQTRKASKTYEKNKKKIEKKISSFDQTLAAKTLEEARNRIDTHEIACECIENGYDEEDIQELWQEQLEQSLSEIPEVMITPFLEEIKKILENMSEELDLIWNPFGMEESFAGFEADSLPWKDLFKSGSLIAGLLSAAAFCWIPVAGWVLAGVSLVTAFFASLFESDETKIRKLKEKLDSVLEEAVDSLVEQMRKMYEEQIFSNIRNKFEAAIKSQQALIQIAEEFDKVNQILFECVEENEKERDLRVRQLEG